MNWFEEIVKAYLSPNPEASQSTQPNAGPQPVFDTPAGLEAILQTAGFADIQVISEAAEFIYATEEEFWSTLWSHGMRGTLERIEQATGPNGLQRFKTDILAKVNALKQPNGFHQLFPVLFALATKPGIRNRPE
jgi:hypothetical protein